MEKQFTLTVPLDFDFNSLNLRRNPASNEFTLNIVPIIEILKLSGIDTELEFTEDQFNEILANLYQFHLSQNKDPIKLIEDKLSAFECCQPPGVKH